MTTYNCAAFAPVQRSYCTVKYGCTTSFVSSQQQISLSKFIADAVWGSDGAKSLATKTQASNILGVVLGI